MIKEIEGRWTCTECGYEWSACMGDNEIPEKCECEEMDVGDKIRYTMEDKYDDSNERKQVEIEATCNSLYMTAKGYEDGCGGNEIVMVEVWEGELRILIWSDINNQDPTHIISLEGARTNKRIEEV